MNKLIPFLLIAFASVASYTPSSLAGDEQKHHDHDHSASGHDHHGPAHGGQFFEDANHHGVEMVVTDKEIIFHMTVEGKPLDMTGTNFKAIVQTDAGTKIHPLTADGSTLKGTLDGPLPKGAKIAVTGKDSHGDVLQARFVKE